MDSVFLKNIDDFYANICNQDIENERRNIIESSTFDILLKPENRYYIPDSEKTDYTIPRFECVTKTLLDHTLALPLARFGNQLDISRQMYAKILSKDEKYLEDILKYFELRLQHTIIKNFFYSKKGKDKSVYVGIDNITEKETRYGGIDYTKLGQSNFTSFTLGKKPFFHNPITKQKKQEPITWKDILYVAKDLVSLHKEIAILENKVYIPKDIYCVTSELAFEAFCLRNSGMYTPTGPRSYLFKGHIYESEHNLYFYADHLIDNNLEEEIYYFWVDQVISFQERKNNFNVLEEQNKITLRRILECNLLCKYRALTGQLKGPYSIGEGF